MTIMILQLCVYIVVNRIRYIVNCYLFSVGVDLNAVGVMMSDLAMTY